MEKEDIKVDKVEFLFQIQSHPDYPSILAIADVLTFFNIRNGVVRVDVSEIELLPKRYIALLIEENDKPTFDSQLYYIEQKGIQYFCTKDKKIIEISKPLLESRWNEIVLLVKKEEIGNAVDVEKDNLFWVLPSLCIGLFLSILFMVEENLETKLFFIFPIIGILFSFAALKDLFGAKSELINNFCNISSTTSCSTIIGSNKWKIFSFVDLSSLSIVFYSTQLVALFMFLLSNNAVEYFYIQKILLFSAVPVVLLSVYYQKFVEKKWCPICLAIVSILVLELGILLLFQENSFNISLKSSVLFGFVFFTIAFVWTVLKTTLTKQKELKEFQLAGTRFMRNYEIFKNSLLAKNSIDLPNSPIVLGNKESDTEITIITSPFCGHCENAQKILEKILTANQDNLKIKVLFNADIDNLDKEKKDFFRSLLSIYVEKGDASFLEALNYWFKTKNLKDWIKIYELPFDGEKMDSIFRHQNQWCKNNNFNFTPAIFVNGFQYPKTYSKENLEFFVNELVEDDFFELV
ncbi:vitamin K epoxide reductase family protein [Flavobacterium sp. GT2N3]|uniref:vitamin K epoxide reductase family protein n=1 Tax=Flavobacterium sp. GT2N3 TaxID=3401733 RepID=UPI003AAE3574